MRGVLADTPGPQADQATHLGVGKCLRALRPPPNLAEETSRAPGLEEEFLQEPMLETVDPENHSTHQQAEDLFEDAVSQDSQFRPRGLP